MGASSLSAASNAEALFMSYALGAVMATYKGCNYAQMVMIPGALAQLRMPGPLECALHARVQRRMDTAICDRTSHNDAPGGPAYDPKILLEVIL
jgi:hypothetical protein